MHFELNRNISKLPDVALVYRTNEYSFATEPEPKDVFTSLMINEIGLGVNAAGEIIEVSGLCAYTEWKRNALQVPFSSIGGVRVATERPLSRGISFKINQVRWPVLVDQAAKLICLLGNPRGSVSIEILPGAILTLSDEGELCALWLPLPPDYRS